ncbi:hypothetical protein H4S08_003485 [Coemansia sp. RSA 1365]|nr:hypothetical protein H4S08_003485 [Coemansia sp. RSA 1365]
MSTISYSESGLDSQDERWDDWEGDEMMAPMKCLFCSETFQNPTTLFSHVKTTHGFDFMKTRSELGLDFYQSMRVVNYIRMMGLSDPKFGSMSSFSIDGSEAFLNDDGFLKPAIPDDSLLYALDELDLDDDEHVSEASSHADNTIAATKGAETTTAKDEKESKLMARIQALEQQVGMREREIKFIAEQFDDYKALVKRQFFDSVDTASDTNSDAEGIKAVAGTSDYYFNSYASNDIHMQMLQDKVRTEGYRDFIYDNKDVFKDKVVLDVGCGTGILSMFAARAGAAKVFAVDNSEIIHKAQANVIENKLDGVITLVKGKIEELELPVEKVDIIISEWMGYFLLFEAMLDSVLVARDRYLAPGGLLAPSASYIYLTAISDEDYLNDKVNYWSNVYGFQMSAMKPSVTIKEADVDVVSSASVVASRALVAEIDHGSATPATLDFTSPFVLTATSNATIHAFAGYFDVAFSRNQATPGPSREDLNRPAYENADDCSPGGPAIGPKPTAKALWKQPESSMGGFTTGPHGIPTHWRQTIFVLRDPIKAAKGDEVHGQISCKKNAENPRELDLEITYSHIPLGTSNQPSPAGETVKICERYQLR